MHDVRVNLKRSDRYAKILRPRNLGQLFVRREDGEAWVVHAWVRSDADAQQRKIYASWLTSALDDLERTGDPESLGWFRSKVAAFEWTLPCVAQIEQTYTWS